MVYVSLVYLCGHVSSDGVLAQVKQRISGFHQDEEGHWVAELECGHKQHTRHNPPLVERSWVLTEDGRKAHLGTELECVICEEEAVFK